MSIDMEQENMEVNQHVAWFCAGSILSIPEYSDYILGRLPGMEAMGMDHRHMLIPFALEVVARPGSREIRVRTAPDGVRIRNRREKRRESEAE